jgi:RecB family endonuclease NucS
MVVHMKWYNTKAEYAVRGELVSRAEQLAALIVLQKEGITTPTIIESKLPFAEM